MNTLNKCNCWENEPTMVIIDFGWFFPCSHLFTRIFHYYCFYYNNRLRFSPHFCHLFFLKLCEDLSVLIWNFGCVRGLCFSSPLSHRIVWALFTFCRRWFTVFILFAGLLFWVRIHVGFSWHKGDVQAIPFRYSSRASKSARSFSRVTNEIEMWPVLPVYAVCVLK